MSMEVGTWYKVRFDDVGVQRVVEPPDAIPWEDDFAWADVIRVCLEVEDFLGTEGLYVFTNERPESYAIPMQADGAPELLQELVRRSLFDGEMAIRAAAAEAGLFCWPEEEPPPAP